VGFVLFFLCVVFCWQMFVFWSFVLETLIYGSIFLHLRKVNKGVIRSRKHMSKWKMRKRQTFAHLTLHRKYKDIATRISLNTGGWTWSSSPVFSGIRLIFSLCSVLLTNVCLLVICLRDIVLMLLISTLVTFLKCRYSLNHYRYLIFISVLVIK
jgi:hypothetical protein